MYDYMTAALPAAGYARYEISNFARPGFESRHNLGYWQDVPYLGVGAAAHSYLDGQRYENPRGIEEYLAALRTDGRARREEEPLTRATSMEEFAFLALLRGIVEKGSVALDGISLTVAAVTAADFTVSLIPHTREVTNLRAKRAGSRLNIETDIIGKYVEKLMAAKDAGQTAAPEAAGGITPAFLARYGF